MDNHSDVKQSNYQILKDISKDIETMKKDTTDIKNDLAYIKKYIEDQQKINVEPIKSGWFY